VNIGRLVMECELVGASLPGVTVEVMRNAELQIKGMGGLVAVGAAAAREGREPAMVVLSYRPTAPSSHTHNSVAWVGKGIVYDTGGLSLKVNVHQKKKKKTVHAYAALETLR
jgi:probable aminopeptidase NPEPL1